MRGGENMNEGRIKMLKEQYPPGTRIQLDHMGNDPNPIPAGTKGTVDFADDIGTVHCTFDNGRQLGLCMGEDSFHKISEPKQDMSPKLSM